MKLVELLEVVDMNKNLYVYLENECITFYDGKNSIDEEYNEYTVINVSADGDNIIVEVIE